MWISDLNLFGNKLKRNTKMLENVAIIWVFLWVYFILIKKVWLDILNISYHKNRGKWLSFGKTLVHYYSKLLIYAMHNFILVIELKHWKKSGKICDEIKKVFFWDQSQRKKKSQLILPTNTKKIMLNLTFKK